VTDAPPPEPRILAWIPEVPPERARRVRTALAVLLLATCGVFSAGLLTGAWSVSKGYPDFRILRAHAQVRQATSDARVILQKHPERVAALAGRTSDADGLVALVAFELDALHRRLDPVEPLPRVVPALRSEAEAVLEALSPFYVMRNEAYLYEKVRIEPRLGRPSTPAAQLEAAGRGLRDIETALVALDHKMRELYPWLGD
jgi:hypothetical protein